MEDLTTNLIKKAWECILKQYTQKIIEESREKGPGVALFLMGEKKNSPTNCFYKYVERGGPIWDKYINYSGIKEKIEEKYDPDTMYLVSVQIPDLRDTTQTIGNIRLFLYENNEEIEL